MYVQVTIPSVPAGTTDDSEFRWLNWLGHILIDYVKIDIGGQTIDTHYGHWLHVWNELTQTAGHQAGYANMVGNVPKLTQYFSGDTNNLSTSSVELYIPLQFWFNRNPGLALPLIALQYHEVKINIKFRQATDCYHCTDAALAAPQLNASLWVDYIYLDTEERRRFAQVSHEYLVEQLQFNSNVTVESQATNKKIDLTFNHPIKSLHWIIQDENQHLGTGINSNPLTYQLPYSRVPKYSLKAAARETFSTMKLQLNGHDRFSVRDADYFRKVQSHQHYDTSPRKYIYNYSFALRPSEHQPSGTCNFSRIDNARMNINFNANHVTANKTLKIYAINYNVLRIMSGMGGLAYSN